jgi:hypothetical protein
VCTIRRKRYIVKIKMFHFYCDDRKVTEIAKNSKEERMLNTETDAKSKKENLIERRK